MYFIVASTKSSTGMPHHLPVPMLALKSRHTTSRYFLCANHRTDFDDNSKADPLPPPPPPVHSGGEVLVAALLLLPPPLLFRSSRVVAAAVAAVTVRLDPDCAAGGVGGGGIVVGVDEDASVDCG